MDEIFKRHHKAAWLALALGAVIFAPAAKAEQSLTLAWNPSSSTNTIGYHLYYGTNGTNFPYVINAGTNTSFVVNGLQEGETNVFVVTSYNKANVDGPPSNEISYITPGLISVNNAGPGNPTIIRFPVAPNVTYQVQGSVDLSTWSTIWQTSATNNTWAQFEDIEGANLKMRFYRLVW